MKKCLKFIFATTLIVAMVAFFAACASPAPTAPTAPPPPPPTEVETPAPPADTPPPADDPAPGNGMAASDIRIALIAHSPDSILDDGSFNQGAWDGINQFLASHGLSSDQADFFQPHEASDTVRIDLITDTIGAGFNILILPGFHFEASLYEAQDMFPDTKFVLLDASPRRDNVTRVEHNVAAIHYAEEQAGFLAGYAAVVDGFRSLGFMGGHAVPAVVRFGHGFIQGAEFAAASLELGEGEVSINHTYVGGFAPSPEIATTAAAWFVGGTEVIFAAAGGAGGSIMSGAEGENGFVIGVDVDQAHLSPTVVTSAIKGLDVSVYAMLTDFLEGNFRGGEQLFDASINGVGLAMGSSRLQNFTQAQYDSIFAQLASGAISVSNSLDMDEIVAPLSLVNVNDM